MKLLIIGGSRFLGRQLVNAALARGHEVTAFNRGRSAPIPGVQEIQGDRHTDLAKLEGRRWDAVIDTCGYLPASVEASARALADRVDRYVFVSSASVYADNSVPGNAEDAPVAQLTDEQHAVLAKADPAAPGSMPGFGDMYGALKALCERTIEDILPGRALQVRPGLIVGEGDYTDRFTYWPVRVARGGKVLAPGRPDRPVQFIDVADLARFIVHLTERKATGAFTANGPPGHLTRGALLDACRTVSNSDATFAWILDEAFLLDRKVAPWMQLPLWIPESDESMRGFMFLDCSKALGAGLEIRPIEDTIRDVLRWHEANAARGPMKAGLDAGREQDLLREWRR